MSGQLSPIIISWLRPLNINTYNSRVSFLSLSLVVQITGNWNNFGSHQVLDSLRSDWSLVNVATYWLQKVISLPG